MEIEITNARKLNPNEFMAKVGYDYEIKCLFYDYAVMSKIVGWLAYQEIRYNMNPGMSGTRQTIAIPQTLWMTAADFFRLKMKWA